jgi:hypothetical protein
VTTRGSIPKTIGESGEVSAAITRRIQSAFRLFEERSSEIVAYLDGTYGVPSRSVADLLYHVDVDHGTCECPDQAKGGHHCAHLFCAEIARAKGTPRAPHNLRASRPANAKLQLRGHTSRRCRSEAGRAA